MRKQKPREAKWLAQNCVARMWQNQNQNSDLLALHEVLFLLSQQPWASTSPGGEVLHTLIYSDNPYQSPGKNWKKTLNVQPKRDRWHAPFIQWSIMDYINKWHAESIVTWHIYHSIKWGKKAKWELCKLNALNNNNETKHAWNNGCLQIVCRFRSSEKQKAKTGINRARNSLEKCPGRKTGRVQRQAGSALRMWCRSDTNERGGRRKGVQCLPRKFQPGQSQGMLAAKLPVGQIWHWNRIAWFLYCCPAQPLAGEALGRVAWHEHPGSSEVQWLEIVVSLRVGSCEGRSEQGTSMAAAAGLLL